MREVVSKSSKLLENCNFLLYPSFRAQHKVQRAQRGAKEKSYQTCYSKSFFRLLMLIINNNILFSFKIGDLSSIFKDKGAYCPHPVPIESQTLRVFVVDI